MTPAAFMVGVSITYILMADEGIGLGMAVSYPIGGIIAVCTLLAYLLKLRKTVNH